MCSFLINGDTAPTATLRTEGGSILVSGMTRFMGTPTEEQRAGACTACRAYGYESVLLVPIRQDGHLLGLIHLADPRENGIPAEMVELLEHASLQLATAIARARTEERLAYLATHDGLTGLATRAEFNRRLDDALTGTRDPREGIAVMVADLDHFKNVNDTLGHDAGDRLLVAIGERLVAVLRDGDMVARIGGDEFVLLLRGINTPGQAVAVASKLLQRIQEPLMLDARTLRVTISIGIAWCPRDGDDGTTLLKHADTAMYRAKSAGRNNYQWYDDTAISLRP